MAVELRPEHALIRALRDTRSETELTRALAAVLGAEPEMASEFVRLVVGKAPHGDRSILACCRPSSGAARRTRSTRVGRT